MNQVFDEGIIPEQFKEALIFPIHKKGSTSDPNNYRGISFLNSSYKIFTTVLQNRLKTWISSKKLLNEFQAGFRAGYSTVDHVFVLKSVAESFLERGKKLYLFFVDFKAAFDTVDRDALIYKLYGLGMTEKFGKILKNLYQDTRSAVWNGVNKSEWFLTKSGVRQGCPLSPDLFSLFINDLIDCLPGGIEHGGLHIKALLFADDVVLMAYSPQSLQLMINKLKDYCNLWNLVVNLEKSKVMIVRKGTGRISTIEKWFFDGNPLEVVKEYKYLGVLITQNMNMEKHLKEKLQKAKTAINATWKNCFKNPQIKHSSKYRVFETVAESIVFYAAQVWGGKKYETVEKLLRFYIKRSFHLPANSPNYMIMLETGLSPLFTKTLKRQIDYILRVMHMSDHRLPKRIAMQTLMNKRGWYDDWKELAESCGMDFNININELNAWKPILYELIEKIDLNFRIKFEEEARSSLYRSVYSRLEYSLSQNNYFKDENSREKISLMFRIRGELLDLDYIPHRNDLQIICDLCNQNEREDVMHFLGYCPVFKETRRNVFGTDILSEDECLSILNEMDANKLHVYLKTALRYRNRIKNACF